MPTSLSELVSFLEEFGYSHTVRSEDPDPVITAGFNTSNYRDADGDPGVQLVIQLLEEGGYLHIFAPKAFDLSECQHRSAALEVLAGIQWRMKLVRFEYDSDDGEVRADVALALEDAPLTNRQFHRLLGVIPGTLDAWHSCIVRAMETGVVDFEMSAETKPGPISFDALPEFTELSEGAAALIGQCETDLDLSGLEAITADDVRALNQKPWSGNESSWSTFNLDLSGLTTLPLDVADALAHRFDGLPDFMSAATLRLDGIESLTAPIAATLAKYRGDLYLNGLKTIDKNVAAALAAHPGALNLDGLTMLGADAARAMGGHVGNISLDGLSEISDAVAAYLLAVPETENSDDDEDGNDGLSVRAVSLGGLERLNPTVAALFVQFAKAQGGGIWLRSLRTLDSATAAVLRQHSGGLMLDGLTDLDAATANELGRCRGNLSLSGLKSLAPGVAKALAAHEGSLGLDSVEALSDGDAEWLSKHKGFLDLGALRELSAAGAQHLVHHVGKLGVSLADLPENLQGILREHPSLFHVEPGSSTLLPSAVRSSLASVSIAEVRANYTGSGDDGGFESFAVTLVDGRVLEDVHDADQLAAALQEVCNVEEASDARFGQVSQMLYQLIWAVLPSGWEIDGGSFGEIVIDVTAGTIALSHSWRGENEEEGVEGEDDGDERDEESESRPHEAAQIDWTDTANQDQLIAADVAELANLLRRGVSRKDWLDAHVDHVPLWEQVAERGTPHGLMMIGLCHCFGIGREVDDDAARPFFEQAANKGEPQAQFSLGQLILNKAREGEGTETERDAYRWFLASAEGGLAQAQFSVAEALWKGEGIEEDERAAVEWMKKAAALGHGQAAFMLAELHLKHRPSAGIQKNRQMAIEWGRAAEAAGHEEAQGWLKKHEHGVILTTDIAEQILENWRENSDQYGPSSRTVSGSIGGDDTEDDDAPPPSAGNFADPAGTIVNSVGMKFVPIPAGEFMMGSPEDCPFGDTENEEFQHRVHITKPFMLGMHQVTQAQYQEVTGENPSFFEGPDLPVEHLTWKQAKRFCEMLSARPAEAQAGRRYRLPTEAEWEYACRAGTTTPFNTGDELEQHQARFASISRGSPKQTAPVGSYPPNAWGLFDMHGNVWEWTNDWFSADYFRESPIDDPQGPARGTHHTLRGGSASMQSHECRTAFRGEAADVDGPETDSGMRIAFYGDLGIRVVCVTPSAQRAESVGSSVRLHNAGRADAVREISQNFRAKLSEVVDGVISHVQDANAKEILGPGLSPLVGRGSIKAIVTFAIYADVLRMVHDMVMADGDISDEEIEASLGLVSLLASGFAKVRKAYAAHANLSAETARGFLSQYEADIGLFGHANESTKWAGLAICHSIHSRCHDGRPLEVFGGALVAWAEAIAGLGDVTPGEQAALNALREHTGQALSTTRPASDITQRTEESEAEPAGEDSEQLSALLAAMDDGDPESAAAVVTFLEEAVATPRNAWGVLLYYLDWNCTQPPNPETDRVGTQSVPLRIPKWGQFQFAHDASLVDLVSEDPPEVWQRLKSFFERRDVTTSQNGDFEMGNWPAERLADTLTQIYGGSATSRPVRVFFAVEADGSGIRIFAPLAIGAAVATPIRASQRWVLEGLFRLAEDDSREAVAKQPITIGGLFGRKKTFGLNTPASLRPMPVAWTGETQWVALDAWRRLKQPLPQLNVGYLVSKDLEGSAFDECVEGAVDSLVTLVDWMASAALESEQVSQQVLPWQPVILAASSAADPLEDACYPSELTLAFARAERGDQDAAALINEYLESNEDVDNDDEDDDEPPPLPISPPADPPGSITNSVGMKLVPLPAGEFLMGSPEDCSLGDPDEEFQHRVRITKPFLIGMHQVTQAQYEHITGGNPSFFRGPDLPVEHLSWKDAKRFCDLLSALPGERQAGRRYRLPTEAEWEYACRAGTTTLFNTGDSLEPHEARFSAKTRSSPKQTAPVGSYPPNAWGLFDMHGNVWEWTNDWFSADYFRESPIDDPQGPATGTHHTLRGGSASVEAHECRTAVRGESAHDGPQNEEAFRYEFYGDFGMRVVCDVTAKNESTGPQSLVQERKPDTLPVQDVSQKKRTQQPPGNAASPSRPSSARDQPGSFSSRTVRIFISSTFRDFAGERDLLVRKVFPELRRRCRERQVELVDVDLRWGITEAEAEQGKVLPICLAEIDRARPFFMGLLGERYGWVPAAGQFDRSLLIEQPWLEEHAGGKSVTELEILHGVLNNPEMAGRAFFYFRDPAWSATQGTDYTTGSEAERAKLADLKDRIRASGFPVVEDYADPEALAERVREDLWTLIDAAYPESDVPDPLTLERRRHEAYAASRRRLYLGGERYFEALDEELAAESPRPVLVRGRSGGGKSALVANWLARWSQADPSTELIVHHLGCGADAADPVRMAVRIMQEIAQLVGEEFKPKSDPDEQLDELATWLATASAWAGRTGRTVLIVLDGLDKLADRRHLRWFPTVLPPGVRLVASCLDGEVLEAAAPRLQWRELVVEPFSAAEQTQFIGEYLGRFRKQLTAEQTRLLQSHPLVGNPLFLLTVLEELRVFGVHEELDQRLATLLSSPPSKQPGEELTVDDAFEHVLTRIEADHGAEAVQRVMEAIWASRAGLYTDEILAIAGVPPATWAGIANALDESLYETSGRINFGHDYLRKAVEDRYAITGDTQRAMHRRLAQYFASREVSARVAEELPWQWELAGEKDLLEACLTDSRLFVALKKRDEYELLAYWLRLGGDIGRAYEAAWRRWGFTQATAESPALNLVEFFNTAGCYTDFALEVWGDVARAMLEKLGSDHPEALKAMAGFARACWGAGSLKVAVEVWEKVLRVRRMKFGDAHIDTLTVMADLAVSYWKVGRPDKAFDMAGEVRRLCREQMGDHHLETINVMNTLAIHDLDHTDDDADDLWGKSLGDTVIARHLERQRRQADGVGERMDQRLEKVHAAAPRRENARLAMREEVVRLMRERMGANHPKTLMALVNLAHSYEFLGRREEALGLKKEALRFMRQYLGSRHPDTLMAMNSLADSLSAIGQIMDSIKVREELLPLMRERLGAGHLDTLLAKDELLKCYEKIGLGSLSDAAAQELGQHCGHLVLNFLTSLSDAAAQALAGHDGWLYLNGLTTLSDVSAESLAKHRGGLNLDGLTSLSDAAASSLAQHGGTLSLNGLISMSDVAAQALAMHAYGLALNGLVSLSDNSARALAQHKTPRSGILELNGITRLSDTAAESFSRHEGFLSLNGLVSLSDAAALSLANHHEWLQLNGLTSLTDVAAQAFANHQGWLELNGLSSLSDAAAAALAQHGERLDLQGLASLGDSPGHLALATTLSRNDGLHLNSLTSLSAGGAHALSQTKSLLCLNGLAILSDGAAQALAEHEGDLELEGLTSLSDSPGHVALAKKLAKNAEYLHLNSLETLGSVAARALSKHDGSLELEGLTGLSDAAAEALAHHGDLSLSDVAQEACRRAICRDWEEVTPETKAAFRGDSLRWVHNVQDDDDDDDNNEDDEEWDEDDEELDEDDEELDEDAYADATNEDECDNEPPFTSTESPADPFGTFTNSIGMKFVPIPAGEFMMGSPEDCPFGDTENEEFQHRVHITKPFMLGMHQVTQAQYQEVTGENPSFFEGPDLPVEHLTWKQAKRFCEMLSARPAEAQAGRCYRLPTEAEWEYACRAGTTTPFNTGDELEQHQARFASTSRGSPKQTAPVGSYPPNAWGLFDMHGNVWEWTNDWFSADYFRESPIDDPQGPATGTHHTLRGGSASVEAHECRCAIRGEASACDGPETDTGNRYPFYGDFGMRVVCQQSD